MNQGSATNKSGIFLLISLVGCLGFLMVDGLESISPAPALILVLSIFTLGFAEFKIAQVDLTLVPTAAFVYGVWTEPGIAVLMTAIALAGRMLLISFVGSRPEDRKRGSRSSAFLKNVSGAATTLFSLTLALVAYRALGGGRLLADTTRAGDLALAASLAVLGLVQAGLVWAAGKDTGSHTRSSRELLRLSMYAAGLVLLGAIGVFAIDGNGLVGYAGFSLFMLALSQVLSHRKPTIRHMGGIAAAGSTPPEIPETREGAFLPARVYEDVLDQAISLLNASSGQIMLYTDGSDTLITVAQRLRKVQEEAADRPATEFPVRLPAVKTDPTKRPEGLISGIPKSDGSGLVLTAPIRDHAGELGMVVVESEASRRFVESDQALLIQHANNSAAAIRSALLYEKLEEQLTEQSLLYQASMQIGETLEPEAVAIAAADSTCVALKADRAAIFRWDPDKGRLLCIASVENGRPRDHLSELTLYPADLPFLQKCLAERKVQRWCAGNAPSDEDRAFLVEKRQAACLLVVPLTLGERTLGIIEATTNNPAGFGPSADWTAQSIAFQTAIALENTELFQWTRAGHDRLMAILNSSREGIIMVDLAGKILLANKLSGEMIGIDRRQLEDKYLDNAELELEGHLGYEAGDLAKLLDALAHHTTYYARNSIFEITGPEHTFLQRNDSPVFDSDGELIGWLIVLRDVTEQRELEQSRHHLTEMIVHDLRGPLTAILSSLTLLKTHIDEGPGSPVVGQALTISERSVQQMLGLVDSLLTMSKLEGGSTHLHLEETDPVHIIREIAEIYIAEANKAGIIMQLDLEPVQEIKLDREKFARVIGNLIDNALKFTPAGGQIHIDLRRLPGHFEFQVSDSGPGVPMEYRDKIFDRYAQVPGVSGRRRGTGIGLAFCKLTVEAHGGRIWVDDSQNGGSAFILRLPYQNPKAETE